MFNIDLLKEELAKISTVIDCSVYYEHVLEIYCKNTIGTSTDFDNIEVNLILPYFNRHTSVFDTEIYKAAFVLKE